MTPLSSLSRVSISTLIALVLIPSLQAADANGTFAPTTAGTYSWDDPANWVADVANGSGFTANFTSGSTGTFNVTVNSDRTIGNLTFANHAWNLQGPNVLTLAGGSTPNVTVSSQVANISATLAGTQGLSTSGSLTLSGNNLYTGTTTISNGSSLTVSHNNALGAIGTGNGTTVAVGGTLYLNNGVTVTGETLTLNGGTGTPYGSIQSNGTATWAGDIILGSNSARIGNNNAAYQLTVSGTISGNPLTVSSLGTVVLSGANTYTGNTTFYRGTLILDGGNNRLPTGTVITMGGTANNSTLNLNGYNQQLGGLVNGGLASTRTVTNSGTAAVLTLSGSSSANFVGTTGTTLITGNLSLVKAGTNSQTLAQTNSYLGDTTVTAGTLVLADNATMTFYIGANGANNQISGVGTMTLDGDFIFDLTGAAAVDGNSWNVVNVGTLNETFGGTFTVQGFTNNAGVWTSGNYQFSQATGILSYGVIPEPATFGMLALGLVGCAALRRFRRLSSR